MHSLVKQCKTMHSHEQPCTATYSHAQPCKTVQNHAQPYKHEYAHVTQETSLDYEMRWDEVDEGEDTEGADEEDEEEHEEQEPPPPNIKLYVRLEPRAVKQDNVFNLSGISINPPALQNRGVGKGVLKGLEDWFKAGEGSAAVCGGILLQSLSHTGFASHMARRPGWKAIDDDDIVSEFSGLCDFLLTER